MVAAMRSERGASRQLLVHAMNGGIGFAVSVPLIVEYEAVLTRPEHLEVIGLDAVQVNEILDDMVAQAHLTKLSFLWRPQLVYPPGEMGLETGINSGGGSFFYFNPPP